MKCDMWTHVDLARPTSLWASARPPLLQPQFAAATIVSPPLLRNGERLNERSAYGRIRSKSCP
eukprot:3771378-Alexandrium_andersonii.AAC.1